MLINKKISVLLFTFIICTSAFSFTAYALESGTIYPQASEYIRSTNVTLKVEGSDGKLLLENKIGATRTVDKLGIKTLEIQTKVNGYWRKYETLVKDSYRYDANTFIYDLYYYGTPGTEYRTYVEFYVEYDGGSETKIVTSLPVTAE
jgi:hypothetical protein